VFRFVLALGWLRYSMRLERLQATEGVLVDMISVELNGIHTGTLSGVRSLISTSLVTFKGSATGLAAAADGGVADCCCIAD